MEPTDEDWIDVVTKLNLALTSGIKHKMEQDTRIALLRRYVQAAEACRTLVDPMYAEGAKMDAWRRAAVTLHNAAEIDLGYTPATEDDA